jgi:hypothetical protein
MPRLPGANQIKFIARKLRQEDHVIRVSVPRGGISVLRGGTLKFGLRPRQVEFEISFRISAGTMSNLSRVVETIPRRRTSVA